MSNPFMRDINDKLETVDQPERVIDPFIHSIFA